MTGIKGDCSVDWPVDKKSQRVLPTLLSLQKEHLFRISSIHSYSSVDGKRSKRDHAYLPSCAEGIFSLRRSRHLSHLTPVKVRA